VKGIRILLTLIAVTLWGCGGGGKNSPTSPPFAPPPQTPGNPSSPPSNPDNQPPSNSPDNPLQPPPPSQPPSNPALTPGIRIWYPRTGDPESVRVVGSGTLLTIIGEAYGADQIVVYDQDGSLLETFEVTPGQFRVDLSRFGTPGRKTLKIVARGPGGESVANLEVVNDEVVLRSLAEGAIQRYGMRRFAWPPYGTEKPIPVYIKLKYLPKEYIPLVEEACEFWTRYTSLKFDTLIIPDDSVIPDPSIVITYENKDPGYIAETRNYGAGGIVDGSHVYLYSRFAGLSEEAQASIIAHEMWHVLFDTDHPGTEFGTRFIGYPYHPFDLSTSTIPPVIQRVIDILYR